MARYPEGMQQLLWKIPGLEELYVARRWGGKISHRSKKLGTVVEWKGGREYNLTHRGLVFGVWSHPGGGGLVVLCEDGRIRQCQRRYKTVEGRNEV